MCVVLHDEKIQCKTPAIETPSGVNLLADDMVNGGKTYRIDLGIVLDGVKDYCNISNISDISLRQKGLLTLLPTPQLPGSSFVREQELYDGMQLIYEVGNHVIKCKMSAY